MSFQKHFTMQENKIEKQGVLDSLHRLTDLFSKSEGSVSRRTIDLVAELKREVAVCLKNKYVDVAEERHISEVVEGFLGKITNENTRSAYSIAFERFRSWYRARGLLLQQVRYRHITPYLDDLNEHYKSSSVRQHVSAIRAVCDWLMVNSFMEANPIPILHMPDKRMNAHPNSEILTWHEIQSLLMSFDEEKFLELRNRAMIGLMVYAFSSTTLLTELRVEDYVVDGEKRFLQLHVSDREYLIPLHHEVVKFLEEYLDATDLRGKHNSFLFPSANRHRKLSARQLDRRYVLQMTSTACKRAKLPKMTPRQLRLTGIVAVMQSSSTKEEIKMLLGHLTTKTIVHYEQMAEGQSDFSELFDATSDISQPLQEFVRKFGIFNVSKDE